MEATYVGGYFESKSMTVGDKTLKNANQSTSGYSDAMLIKYNQEGEVEWATSVGGDNDDEITCITATSDGGYIAGGYFKSKSITIGDKTLTNAYQDTSYSYSDGMLIKYNQDGRVEWTTSVGENYEDYIECITATSDGGYICRRIF